MEIHGKPLFLQEDIEQRCFENVVLADAAILKPSESFDPARDSFREMELFGGKWRAFVENSGHIHVQEKKRNAPILKLGHITSVSPKSQLEHITPDHAFGSRVADGIYRDPLGLISASQGLAAIREVALRWDITPTERAEMVERFLRGSQGGHLTRTASIEFEAFVADQKALAANPETTAQSFYEILKDARKRTSHRTSKISRDEARVALVTLGDTTLSPEDKVRAAQRGLRANHSALEPAARELFKAFIQFQRGP